MAIAGSLTAEEWAALAVSAAAAAGEYYNTQQTAKRQDRQLAASITNQTAIQKKANQRVNQTIQQLQGSTSDQARQQRLADYMGTLQKGKAKITAGLTGQPVGGATFQADAANAAQQAQDYGQQTAGLLSRIDAPAVQRQAEGTDYGHLATDLSQIGMQSQGQAFLDRLRLAAIRRNAKIDLAAGLLGAAGGAMGGSGGGNGALDTSLDPNTPYYGPGSTIAYGQFGGNTGPALSRTTPYYGPGSTRYLQ